MRKVNKFTFCAILFAMLLVQPLLADIIPTEGIWDDERYRSINTNCPPSSINRRRHSFLRALKMLYQT